MDDLHTIQGAERLVILIGKLSPRTEAVVIAEEEIRHVQLLMQDFADEGLCGVGCQLSGEDHRYDLKALKLPQSLEVAAGWIDVLTPVRAQNISRVRDEGHDDETRPFVAGSIVAHLREERLMPEVHAVKSPDSSDYLLIHARGLSLVRSCQSWKCRRRPEEPSGEAPTEPMDWPVETREPVETATLLRLA